MALMRFTHVFLAASLTLAACSGDSDEMLTETPAAEITDAAGEVDTADAEVDTDDAEVDTADAEVDTDSGDTVDEPADAVTHDSGDTAPEPSAAPSTTATSTSAPTTTRARPSTTTTWKGLQVPENAGTLPPEDIDEHDHEPVDEPVVIEVGVQGTAGGVTYEYSHVGVWNQPDPKCGGAYDGSSEYRCSCTVNPEKPDIPERCRWSIKH